MDARELDSPKANKKRERERVFAKCLYEMNIEAK